jgi:hypothetical protein
MAIFALSMPNSVFGSIFDLHQALQMQFEPVLFQALHVVRGHAVTPLLNLQQRLTETEIDRLNV